jgi:hypothetical protein
MPLHSNNSFVYYYFDIETVPMPQYIEDEQASFDPLKAKIITIQYQPLDIKTGKAIGELTIMKEWGTDSSERYIIESFKRLYLDNGIWTFIPVGNNLVFECRFMKYKFKQYCNLKDLYLGHRPMIDLKHILIIMNGGKFRGCAELIGKTGNAKNMSRWYNIKDFDAIEQYIKQEATNFITAYSILKMELPKLRYQIAGVLL